MTVLLSMILALSLMPAQPGPDLEIEARTIDAMLITSFAALATPLCGTVTFRCWPDRVHPDRRTSPRTRSISDKEDTMKSAKLVSLGAALALALGILMYNTIGVSAGPTAVLTTPPLPSNADQFMQCYIVNVSSATKTVTVQVIGSTGTIKGSNVGLVLDPGEGSGLATSGANGGYYCRFLVDRADFYRASIAVMGEPLAASGQGTLISSLPAW